MTVIYARDWSTKSGDSDRDENIYGLLEVLKFKLAIKSDCVNYSNAHIYNVHEYYVLYM